MSKWGQGRCVYCGRRRALTSKGRIRRHYVVAGPTTLRPGQTVMCGGSGRVPS